MLALAFVNFFKEKSGSRRIVSISEFDDFNPSHHSDFNDNQTYLVKWAHLPSEGSSSTTGLYEAKVLCLGADINDLKLEAKNTGLKITQAMISDMEERQKAEKGTEVVQTVQKSSRGRSIKKSAILQDKQMERVLERTTPQSRMPKKKKKVSLEDTSRGNRQQKSLLKYDNNLLFSSVDKSVHDSTVGGKSAKLRSVPSSKSSCSDTDRIVDLNNKSDSTQGRTSSIMVQSQSNFNEDSIEISESKLVNKKQNPTQCFIDNSDSKASIECYPVKSTILEAATIKLESDKEDHNQPNNVTLVDLSSLSDTDRSTKSMSEPSLNSKKVDKVGFSSKRTSPSPVLLSENPYRSNRRKLSESSSTSNTISSTDSIRYESGSEDPVKELYYNKMRKLEIVLKAEQTKNKTLENQVESLQETVETHQKTIQELKEESQRYSKVNLSLSEKLMNALAARDELSTDRIEIKKEKNSGVKYLDFPSPAKTDPPSQVLLVAPKCESPFKTDFTANNTLNEDSDSLESVNGTASNSSPNKSNKKSGNSSSKKRKKSVKSEEEEDFTSNVELGQMILLALQSKAPLLSDGNGKVHLGNGVWINEKDWSGKIRRSAVSPSIAVRDAMDKLYTKNEMAERSLEGGTPVKPGPDGKKTKKIKLTPKKREALLGLYRAKTAATSGSNDKCFLDLAVSKKGRDTIRYKLKDSFLSINPNKKS